MDMILDTSRGLGLNIVPEERLTFGRCLRPTN